MLQYKKAKLIFEIVSALILLPIISSGAAFYITLFIFLIDRVVDAFYSIEESVFVFYEIWKMLNQWLGVFVCAFAFCMLYPGFENTVKTVIQIDVFNTLLMIVVLSDITCGVVETIHLDIRSKKVFKILKNEKEDAGR